MLALAKFALVDIHDRSFVGIVKLIIIIACVIGVAYVILEVVG